MTDDRRDIGDAEFPGEWVTCYSCDRPMVRCNYCRLETYWHINDINDPRSAHYDPDNPSRRATDTEN